MNQKTVQKAILCIFILLGQCLFAQDNDVAAGKPASVEKSLFSAQIGPFGIWLSHELKLFNRIALRTELGYADGIWKESHIRSRIIFSPSVVLEPRWYYNIRKRQENSKDISNNSGNFVAVKARYFADEFIALQPENAVVISSFSLIPTWGHRGNIAKGFYYETALGFGYRFFINEPQNYYDDGVRVDWNFYMRLGYAF